MVMCYIIITKRKEDKKMTPYWELNFIEAYKRHLLVSNLFSVRPSNPITFFFQWFKKRKENKNEN